MQNIGKEFVHDPFHRYAVKPIRDSMLLKHVHVEPKLPGTLKLARWQLEHIVYATYVLDVD